MTIHVIGEEHGTSRGIMELVRLSTRMCGTDTLIAMEALPVGDAALDDDYARRVSRRFDRDGQGDTRYMRLARMLRLRGFVVVGLEAPHHRPPQCMRTDAASQIRCALSRACLPSSSHCIESDWVSTIDASMRKHKRRACIVLVGALHVDPLKRYIIAHSLLTTPREC